jgi:adenine-specific DNA-methyltransferase
MAEKLKMASKGIVNENIEFIESRFPNAVTETLVDGTLVKKIDFDVLKQELSNILINEKQERYQMTWPEKKKSFLLANSSINKTLIPNKDMSVDFDNTKNLYIEGDNLEALKIIRETYLNEIKFIYIDPPYNKDKDYIYNDSFSEKKEEYIRNSGQVSDRGDQMVQNFETSGRFHTKWLNMIYPRLKIAKDLLKEDGVIFISIDDKEYANLKKIMDEIFNENNYIATLKWKKKKQPSFLSNVANIIEYIIVYSKNANFIKKLSLNSLNDSDKPIINGSNRLSERLFEAGIRVKKETNLIRKGKIINKSMEIEFLDDIYIKDGKTVNKFRAIAKFRNDQENINQFIKNDLIFITKNFGLRRDLSEEEKGSEKTITDLLLDWGQNQDGSNELKELFHITEGEAPFENPKPVLLIKNLISTICQDNDIVLDFFSGSATTADAVFNYNIEEGANLKFILVQFPEVIESNRIAYKMGYRKITEIARERIKLAKNKLIEKYSLGLNSIDFGFRAFRIETSNLKDTYYNPSFLKQELLESTVENVKEDRTPLDLLFQVMLELGIELSVKIEEKETNGKKYFIVNESYLIACFDSQVDEKTIREIAKIKPVYAVFRDGSFSNDSSNINCEQIIKSISPSSELKVL